MSSGRGRGVSNAPAWMAQRQGGGGHDGPSGQNGPPNGRDLSPNDRKGGGGPRPRSRSRSRSRSPPRDPYGRSSRRGGGGPSRRREDDRYGPPRGGPPPRGGLGPGGPGGWGPGPGGPPPPHRHRGRGPPPGGPGGHHPRNYRPNRNDPVRFRSAREEREWLDDRRRARRNRRSLFDVLPTEEQLQTEREREVAAAASGELGAGSSLPGACLPVAWARNGAGRGAPQPQQTRHARRLYIGQLPLDVSEAEVHQFFKECIRRATGRTEEEAARDNDPILSVYINRERRFSFVEFRTMEVCTACLALDGIDLLGKGKVKVKRPNDYNPATCAVDAQTASSSLDFDVSRLGIVSGSVPDGPNKIFIGGLPYHLTEDQVLELLGAFGQVRAFHLVKADNLASTSKGYCFVEYSDPKVTPVAVMGLNGMPMGGDKVLSARMAAARGSVPSSGSSAAAPSAVIAEQEQARARMAQPVDGVDVEALLNAALDGATTIPTPGAAARVAADAAANDPAALADAAIEAALGNVAPAQPTTTHSRVLVLLNMVTDEDLATDEEYADLRAEVEEECSKFGTLRSMEIPRPGRPGPHLPSAVRKIFLEYASVGDAVAAERELAGRQFGENVVQTQYLSEEDFAAGRLK